MRLIEEMSVQRAGQQIKTLSYTAALTLTNIFHGPYQHISWTLPDIFNDPYQLKTNFHQKWSLTLISIINIACKCLVFLVDHINIHQQGSAVLNKMFFLFCGTRSLDLLIFFYIHLLLPEWLPAATALLVHHYIIIFLTFQIGHDCSIIETALAVHNPSLFRESKIQLNVTFHNFRCCTVLSHWSKTNLYK